MVSLPISEVPFYEHQWKAQNLVWMPIVSGSVYCHIYVGKKPLYARSSVSDKVEVVALGVRKWKNVNRMGDITHLGSIISIMPQLCFHVLMGGADRSKAAAAMCARYFI